MQREQVVRAFVDLPATGRFGRADKAPPALATGRGVLQWIRNGVPAERYDGEMKDGLYEGRGLINYGNGTRYDGDFRAGEREGRGTFVWSNGNRYIGDFRAGLVASFIGAVPAVLVGGVGTLLTVLLCIRLFPELYRVESFHSQQESGRKER